MRVLNVAKVGQTHKVKCRLLFQLARCTNRACCQSHHVKMFIKAAMPRYKRNQNSELFFRQSPEVFGCLQLWVFNSKFGRSNGVVVGLLTATPKVPKVVVTWHPKQHHPVVIREILQ
jgi:hypothetical protein